MEMFESIDQLLRLAPGFALKFLVAVICGGAIGMERETTGKPAGLRTSIIICVGSMIFTVMSVEMARAGNADPTRIAAQIVSGIGFLGAGVILHQKGGTVKGMTTAAIIWLIAALGMMIGFGYLLSASAVTVAIVVMILALQGVERQIHNRLARDYTFIVPDGHETRERIVALLYSYDDNVDRFSIESIPGASSEAVLDFRFSGSRSDRRELLGSLYQLEGVRAREKR